MSFEFLKHLFKFLKPNCIQILCLMVLWGQIQNYMMRVNLGFSIVDMVKENSTNSTEEKIEGNITYPILNTGKISSNQDDNIDWSSGLKGIVLSAHGYGYVTTQVIGGRMAEKFGAKKSFV